MPSLRFGKVGLKAWDFTPDEGFRQRSMKCVLMRNLSSDLASRPVYLWSPTPDSVNRTYHKIRGPVKRKAPAAASSRRGGACAIPGETVCKVVYQSSVMTWRKYVRSS